MDDLSRVKHAAEAANDFNEFRNTLQNEMNGKYNEEKQHPNMLRPQLGQTALVHTDQCATNKDRTKTQGSIHPCSCGVTRRYRQGRADAIEAHLDSGGTCSHRNALELRDHWYEAEQELSDALGRIENLEALCDEALERGDS